MPGYVSKPMEELAKQLTAGLVRLRRGYIDSAEALLRIIKPGLEYPYEFVVYRLTGYRPARGGPAEAIAAHALRHDLLVLILELCNSIHLPAGVYDEPVYDTAQLARRFKVSTKTIQRWRRRGLVARRLVFPDGRRRIAFLASSVREFVERRRRRTLRSVRFSQLSPQERDEIIRQARRIVAEHVVNGHPIEERVLEVREVEG